MLRAEVSLSIDRDLCLLCRCCCFSCCVNARWNPETNETKRKPRC